MFIRLATGHFYDKQFCVTLQYYAEIKHFVGLILGNHRISALV